MMNTTRCFSLLLLAIISLAFAPAVLADDDAGNLVDSVTAARGEPECTHETPVNQLDSAGQAALANDSATAAAQVGRDRPGRRA